MGRLTKLGAIVTTLLVVTLASSPAVEIGAFASWLDGNDLDGGEGAGILLEFGIFEDTFALDLRGSYVGFDHVDMYPIEATLKFRLPMGRVGAIAGLGVGYYIMEPDNGSSDEAIGGYPMLGLDVVLNERVTLFGEARWLFLETDMDAAEAALENLDSDSSVDIDGVGVNLGLTVGF